MKSETCCAPEMHDQSSDWTASLGLRSDHLAGKIVQNNKYRNKILLNHKINNFGSMLAFLRSKNT